MEPRCPPDVLEHFVCYCDSNWGVTRRTTCQGEENENKRAMGAAGALWVIRSMQGINMNQPIQIGQHRPLRPLFEVIFNWGNCFLNFSGLKLK